MTSTQKQTLAAEFSKTIIIPDGAKHLPQFCICLIGLHASGKSTILRKITEKIPVVILSGDALRKFSGIADMSGKDVSETIGPISEKLFREGYNIAHDGDFSNPDLRHAKYIFDSQHGIREIWLHLDPPLSWIIKQLRERTDDAWRFPNMETKIASMKLRLPWHLPESLKDVDFTFRFDPSLGDTDAQVEQCVKVIQKELGAVPSKKSTSKVTN